MTNWSKSFTRLRAEGVNRMPSRSALGHLIQPLAAQHGDGVSDAKGEPVKGAASA